MHESSSLRDAPVGGLSIAGITRGVTISITFDGNPVAACTGESLSAALCRAEIATCRLTAKAGAPRGYYCGMGVCFECLVEVDGVPGLRACRTTVKPGMRVRTEST